MSEGTSTEPPIEVVLVTGYSGAGRSTAARALEDIGYYVVDNLPPRMIPGVIAQAGEAGGSIDRIAIVTDARTRAFGGKVDDIEGAIEALGARSTLVFLDAADDVLVRRFENVRRAHPMQGSGTITEGIAAERELLKPVRAIAEVVIDTSKLSVHDLRRRIELQFGGEVTSAVRLMAMSFGFKYGLPLDADFVFDVRFLPNPYWVPELRAMDGRGNDVSEYVLTQPDAEPALDHIIGLMNTVIPGYRREGKRYVTVAIGCTGGKHRSVAVAEEIARRLAAPGVLTRSMHRDLGKE